MGRVRKGDKVWEKKPRDKRESMAYVEGYMGLRVGGREVQEWGGS